jgi:capsular exopolysaccharide synthesis family protein
MTQDLELAMQDIRDKPRAAGSFGVLRSAWHHKLLVALGVIIGLVLGLLYYLQAPPVYQSSAQVLVIKKRPDFALPGAASEVQPHMEDYLATHQVLIRSPRIIGQAVQKGKLRELQSLADLPGDPTGAIAEDLKVSREKEVTTVLNLSFRGPVREDCKAVLSAVLESYKEFLDTTYHNVSEDTVKLISQARDLLETKIDQKQREYRKFRLSNPNLLRAKDGTSVVQDRLINLEAKKSALQIRQAEIQGRINAFEKAQKDGRSRGELLAMVSDSLNRLGLGPGKSVLDDPLTALRLEKQTLLETFGSDHPRVQAVQRRLDVLQARSPRIVKDDDLHPLDPVLVHVQMLGQELEDAKGMVEALVKLLRDEQAAAKELIGNEVQEEAYRTDIAQTQQLFETVIKRLQEINILKDFGGYSAETIAAPSRARKVAPRAMLILSAAGLLGLLCGMALAYGAELSEMSFHSPEEIRRRLGLPVVGHIPFFQPRGDEVSGADGEPVLEPSLCTYYHTKSREAESYRGVRTALYFSTRGQSHSVVQVTSPDMGDGKTTLVANLAVSIAQSGKRVLLVDADFRRPRLHKMFSVPAERGLASVISGEAELADVIQASTIPGLSVLPCGPHPPNPAELLSQPRVKELLEYLREQYDFVVIDSPPLLAVTDPCVLVPHVDGVFLTIRIGKNVRLHAERAKEVLSTLGANILGVVVNETDRNASSVYGYSGYRYGYGYGYRYYAADKSNSYYTDPEAEEGAGTDGAGGSGQTAAPVGGAATGSHHKRSWKSFLRSLLDRL